MPQKEAVNPLSPDQYSLVLTGQRGTEGQRRQFHVVLFCGQPAHLCYGAFMLLLQLARACRETCTGYLGISPMDAPQNYCLGICRLRSQLDKHLGPEAGKHWIQTGACTEYRLTIPPNAIAIDRSFKELPRHLVSEDLRGFLITNYPEVTLGNSHDTRVQLERNG